MQQAVNGLPAEMLSFRLGSEEYGLNILKVQEIRGYDTVTSMPQAPDYFKGVINLRGVVVPIIDLRIRFRAAPPTYDQFTVVIILNILERVVGIVVDSVSDVVTLEPEQIKPAPEIRASFDADALIGLGILGERMLILLDIDKVIADSETVAVALAC